MPTNNPNRLQQMQQVQQPIILQQVTPAVNVQQTKTPKPVLKKSLNWSKTSVPGRDANVETRANALIKDIRENLSNLRHLHKALMNAKSAELPYQKEYLNKADEYNQLLEELNELERGNITQSTVTELQIITDKLAFDRVRIDAIFPEITDKAMQMDEQITVIVNKIGFKEFYDQAEVELNQIKASEQKMILEDKKNNADDNDDNAKASISSAVYMISIFNEMKESEKRILALKKEDEERAKRTQRSFLVGMALILLAFIILLFTLYKMEVSWKSIKDYPLLGIPLGVCIWSFIGSFAAMLTQFYKEPIYNFGDPLKWVIIRPVLGIVMGAAIYLALFSLVLTGKSQNDLLPLLVAFFVGYSDTFTFDIMSSIQGIISSLFNSTNSDDIKNNVQPVYMMAAQQPATTVVTTQPATTVVTSDAHHQDTGSTNNANTNNTNPSSPPTSVIEKPNPLDDLKKQMDLDLDKGADE
ncbi:hypothetical protein [Aureispira sp. CCB-QB1]|uniref:hypothetical protein n=1 Tax=Aureispira sp. CCB-QB1 TaxID=1313421 RepID=UPI0006990D01|nr:hypothetical protein [Aureispira sp. CCB-QB1]